MGGKLRVGVIFGGRSGEHEVSLASARSVMEAIDRDKFEVVPIGITKEGRWIASGAPLKALESGAPEESRPAALLGDPYQGGLMRLSEGGSRLTAESVTELDVIFPVLHGPYGEDGTVQGLLELADIPYVGAGVLGSALGMDKIATKDIFRSHGLPVVKYLPFKRRDWERDPVFILDEIEAELGYPCFIKPANLGSSVGITKAHNREELIAGMEEAVLYDRRLLVEEGLNAREIEVSVLGNDEPITSLPGEVVPCNEFYDYAAKYIDEDSELLIPAPISSELTERIRKLAVEAYLTLDCAGMARADFLLDRGSDALYISELNTIPGFTPISMYPKLWEATGLSYPKLIERLIELALERHKDKSRSRTSYAAE
ncbi:MAG: D-alanine--D-alanine ligase [Chloroflexota bacterium]|nr:D-alanine--D-alanine ligase [Chloroflexota bacterium]